jgi:16S rRNA processing protein RimM
MQEPLLAIARIVAPHGIRGEVKAQIVTDFPQRFRKTSEVWLGAPPVRMRLERARVSGRQVILKLEGVETREQAERLRSQLVHVSESQAVSLPPGEYFWHQVIGLEVLDDQGASLGRVAEIIETGSNHVYVIRGERGEWLLPAIKQVITRMNPAAGTIQVNLLPGMGPEPSSARTREAAATDSGTT